MATSTPTTATSPWSIVKTIRQSPPVDLEAPYDTASLAGKTILITGGASGFGAAFARKWASHGSHIIIGDVNDQAGEAIVAELRSLPNSSQHHHYQHCDVTNWSDQVALFKLAAKASPTGGIDAVVAGAGIVDHAAPDSGRAFDHPGDLTADAPPAPPLNVLAVNLTGVMYTSHLALFWLDRNGTTAEGKLRDRHLLLVSSIAGMIPLPGQTEYAASKHAVVGLFRTLRGTVWQRGIRCNVVCPYFVHTPLMPTVGVALLAGSGMAQLEDVVDAATRLMADEGIVGRGLVIGPKFRVVDGEDGEMRLELRGEEMGNGREKAVWEAYAHDYEQVEVFVYRFVQMLNALKAVRGWVATVKDLYSIYVRGRRVEKGVKTT
ncbi:hypothetical protein B0T17DRAFT_614135 [Bombardia bombarda]|uniref:Uncharacterized protein n=1 Tax=Bombardia bombarda TaxID=252184 RepID=A0AA39X6S7_9PEZI|nr:hypothetical protein B0T17DRAFT_614135 [Bombardia bombarda]